MSKQIPTLQILLKENIIWYNGIAVKGTGLEFEEFLSSLPQNISSENDKLQFFTFYDENDYKVEKLKNFYDFKLKSSRDFVYDPQIPVEDAKYLVEKSVLFYEELRTKQLSETKDKIKSDIENQLKYVVISLRSYRNQLLQKSDWTQTPDVPFSDIDRKNWIKYRQVLRDMPNHENWNYNTSYSIVFPIDPSTYKLRYPNYEVEYLSTPDQFENRKVNKERQKMIDIVTKFNLPSVNIENITQLDYINLITEVNRILSKVDSNLKVKINLGTDNPENEISGDVRLSLDYSGMTPEVLSHIENKISKSGKYTEEQVSQFIETLKILELIE